MAWKAISDTRGFFKHSYQAGELEAAVERLIERIVRRLAWSGEVHDSDIYEWDMSISPLAEVPDLSSELVILKKISNLTKIDLCFVIAVIHGENIDSMSDI